MFAHSQTLEKEKNFNVNGTEQGSHGSPSIRHRQKYLFPFSLEIMFDFYSSFKFALGAISFRKPFVNTYLEKAR